MARDEKMVHVRELGSITSPKHAGGGAVDLEHCEVENCMTSFDANWKALFRSIMAESVNGGEKMHRRGGVRMHHVA